MSIKSVKYDENKERDSEYPYVGVLNDNNPNVVLHVLFVDEDCGVVIHSENAFHEVGGFSCSWEESCFKKFKGAYTVEFN